MGIHTNTKTQNIIMSAPAPKVKKAPAAHPNYSVMIAAAITTLNDRTGSSRQAILKFICANNKVDAVKAAVQVRLALKRGVGKGAGSYKVVKVEKPKKVKKVKKPKAKKPKKVKKAKKPAAKKAKKPKKAAKKPAAKKAAPKKK